MNPSEFDYETSCNACEGTVPERYDTCPACGDGRHAHHGSNGRVNRLRTASDGYVRLAETVNPNGLVIINEQPIEGGKVLFVGGDGVPDPPTPEQASDVASWAREHGDNFTADLLVQLAEEKSSPWDPNAVKK